MVIYVMPDKDEVFCRLADVMQEADHLKKRVEVNLSLIDDVMTLLRNMPETEEAEPEYRKETLTFCGRCGRKIKDSWISCPHCGLRIKWA